MIPGPSRFIIVTGREPVSMAKLGLHLWLEGKSGSRFRWPKAGLHAIDEGDGTLLIQNFNIELDAKVLFDTPRTGPQRRRHAAFRCNLVGEPAAHSRLHELQRTVEIGFADAVGADEQIDAREIHADLAQGSVIAG